MKPIQTFLNVLTAIVLLSAPVFGQDTLVSYSTRTKTMEILPPVEFDPYAVFDTTSTSIGEFENNIRLPNYFPKENLYNHSEFTRLEPAADFFDLTNYPIRTAVRMFRYQNDSLKGACSGIMVSENMVLTAAHCLISINSVTHNDGSRERIRIWSGDSIFVSPAYNDGKNQKLLPNAFAINYYIFKNYYDNLRSDIALMELAKPIGRQLGWIGLAYAEDTVLMNQKVLHKLSYPRIANPYDSTEIFNGDTLYYNFGKADFSRYSQYEWIEVKGTQGIPGQSGSSLFFESNNRYYTVGVLNTATDLHHQGITPNSFYQLKNILENSTSSGVDSEELIAKVYPNPVASFGVFLFENPLEDKLCLEVYNSSGQRVLTKCNITSQSIRIDRNELQKGVLFFQVYGQNKIVAKGKFMVL